MREREAAVGERVRKASGVEIHAKTAGLGPVDPTLEVLHGVGIAIHLAAAEVGITGVQVEAVLAGDQRQRLLEVSAQFVDRPGFPGVVASGLNAAAGEHCIWFFKTADVVSLPAVQGDRRSGERGEHGLGIDAEGGITFFGEGVGCVGHGSRWVPVKRYCD